jgi:hypothetical protein
MIDAASIEKLRSGSKQLKKIAKSAKKEKRAYIDALRCPSRADVKKYNLHSLRTSDETNLVVSIGGDPTAEFECEGAKLYGELLAIANQIYRDYTKSGIDKECEMNHFLTGILKVETLNDSGVLEDIVFANSHFNMTHEVNYTQFKDAAHVFTDLAKKAKKFYQIKTSWLDYLT